MSTHLETLRRAFATLTPGQKANVRKHLAAGVRPLGGDAGAISFEREVDGATYY